MRGGRGGAAPFNRGGRGGRGKGINIITVGIL